MAKIIFVDKNDVVIGAGTREEALEKGTIHRVVWLFLLNSRGELLIQKRSKYVSSPNKWDASASGHVDEGEDYLEAAKREVTEELGVKDILLTELGKTYTEKINGVQIQNRYNMLYSAIYDGEIKPNALEVAEVRWIRPQDLKAWIQQQPDDFTQGFRRSFSTFLDVRN